MQIADPADDLILRERVAKRVRALQLPAAAIDVLEEPPIVEERELSARSECLLDGDAGELAGAPEAPPIAERDPIDECLRLEPLLEHQLIDVSSGERIRDDLTDLLVRIALRGACATDPPIGDDGATNLGRDVKEHTVRRSFGRAREEDVHHLLRGADAPSIRPAVLLHRKTEFRDGVRAIVALLLLGTCRHTSPLA